MISQTILQSRLLVTEVDSLCSDVLRQCAMKCLHSGNMLDLLRILN